jgi:flagellar biosynthesis/type III secretory pathway ATPase
MRYFNLMLSSAEVDAYTADYLEQAGPRADAARMLLRVVAVTARITTEMEELKRSRNSRSVWKLHADSLVVLVDLGKRLAEAVDRLALAVGEQAETQANSESLHNSLEKLRERIAEAARLIGEA